MLASGVYRHHCFLGMALAFVGLSAAQDRAAALLDGMLDAHGGLERFRSLAAWHIVAERNLFGGGDPEHEVYEEFLRHADSRLMTLLVKRGEAETLVFGHDGSRGFSIADGKLRDDPEAEGEGYYRAHGEYYLRAIPFKWTDAGVNVSYGGREEPNLELLEIRAEEGVGRDFEDVRVAAIDSETHLLREARLSHRGELRASHLVPGVEYLQANRIRRMLMDEVASVMSDLDVVLSPWRPINPLTSMTGHPVVTLKNGFTAEGTPTGIAIMGQIHGEVKLLAFAKAVEEATEFHHRHPSI